MTSKAQIAQVFIFMAALIVLVSVAVLGTLLVRSFTKDSCEQSRLKFKQDLSLLLDANKAYGSRRTFRIDAPCDAVTICFIDTGAIGNPGFESGDPTMNAAVKGGVPTTVFLQQKGDIPKASGDESRIILRTPSDPPVLQPLCLNITGGQLSLTLHGFGKQIRIMP